MLTIQVGLRFCCLDYRLCFDLGLTNINIHLWPFGFEHVTVNLKVLYLIHTCLSVCTYVIIAFCPPLIMGWRARLSVQNLLSVCIITECICLWRDAGCWSHRTTCYLGSLLWNAFLRTILKKQGISAQELC